MAASPAESVTLSPSKIAIILDQGKQATVKITAINTLKTAIVIDKIDAWDFAVDTAGNPAPIPAADAVKLRGAAAWIRVPGKPITVGPGQRVVFPVKVLVDGKAREGTHYTFIRASISPGAPAANRVKINLQLNTLLLVTVGVESNPAKLRRKMTVDKSAVPGYTFRPAPLAYLIHNDGNVHETVTAKVELLAGTRILHRVAMGTHIILPGTSRWFRLTWGTLPLVGKYTVRTTFTGGPKPIVVDRAMWVVSPTMWLLAGTALIFILWGAFFVRRFTRDFEIVRKE